MLSIASCGCYSSPPPLTLLAIPIKIRLRKMISFRSYVLETDPYEQKSVGTNIVRKAKSKYLTQQVISERKWDVLALRRVKNIGVHPGILSLKQKSKGYFINKISYVINQILLLEIPVL